MRHHRGLLSVRHRNHGASIVPRSHVQPSGLFRRGDTFGVNSNTGSVQTDDWEVGAFGTGPRPIIDSGSYSGTAITLGEAPNGRIMDLHFVGDNTTTDSKPIYFDTTPSGECSGVEFDNLLISNVLVEDFGNGFNLRGNTQSGAEQYRPECANDNIVIYESAVVNATTSTRGGVDLFMHASSGAILGGDYGNRQSHEVKPACVKKHGTVDTRPAFVGADASQSATGVSVVRFRHQHPQQASDCQAATASADNAGGHFEFAGPSVGRS